MQPSQPTLTRFWVKVHRDDKTATPQFVLETGDEQAWGEHVQDLARVLLLPFNPELAGKVIQQGGLAVPSRLPVVEICANESEMIGVRRENDIETSSCYHCSKCKHIFQWMGDGPLKCPKCGAVNEWYCTKCDEVKENPVFCDNGEVRCPDCAEPQGLKRTDVLVFVQNPPKHTYIYKIEVGDRLKIEVSDTVIRVV